MVRRKSLTISIRAVCVNSARTVPRGASRGNPSVYPTRTRRAEGSPNRMYVHEVFTEEEIENQRSQQTESNHTEGSQFASPFDFYKSLLAGLVEVNPPKEDLSEAKPLSPGDEVPTGDGNCIRLVSFQGKFGDKYSNAIPFYTTFQFLWSEKRHKNCM